MDHGEYLSLPSGRTLLLGTEREQELAGHDVVAVFVDDADDLGQRR